MRKAKFSCIAGVLLAAMLIMGGCAKPSGPGNPGIISTVEVTSVSITTTGPLSFSRTGNDPFSPVTATLHASVLPAEASQAVTWTSRNPSVATVSANGVVTPVATATNTTTIYATSVGVNAAGQRVQSSNEITVNVTVSGGGGGGGGGNAELALHNQATAGTTTTSLETAWNDTTKKFTISNDPTLNSANRGGFANNDATNPYSVQRATFVYFDQALGNDASISAKIKFTARNGSGGNNAGLIIGMIKDPLETDVRAVKFAGIRAGSQGNLRGYISREGVNAATGTEVTGQYDNELILKVTRTGAQAYSMTVNDTLGTFSTTNADDLGNAYPGFIIACATVEISDIEIYEGATLIYESGASVADNPTGVQFTAPTSAATYTHVTAGGNNTLTLTAKVIPSGAPQDITWDITGATPTTGTGTSLVITVPNTGSVTAIAKATENPALTATLTITLTDVAPTEVVYEFSTITNVSEGTRNGLTFGSGLTRNTNNNASISDGGYSNNSLGGCYVGTGGAASASQRYIVVPLTGPATVAVYATGNNGSTTPNINITTGTSAATAASNTTNSAELGPYLSQSSGVVLPGPTLVASRNHVYTSTTQGTHYIALKASGSTRIFLIRVLYD